MITVLCIQSCRSITHPSLTRTALIGLRTEKPKMYKPIHHKVDGRLGVHCSCLEPNILSTGARAVRAQCPGLGTGP